MGQFRREYAVLVSDGKKSVPTRALLVQTDDPKDARASAKAHIKAEKLGLTILRVVPIEVVPLRIVVQYVEEPLQMINARVKVSSK